MTTTDSLLVYLKTDTSFFPFGTLPKNVRRAGNPPVILGIAFKQSKKKTKVAKNKAKARVKTYLPAKYHKQIKQIYTNKQGEKEHIKTHVFSEWKIK